MVSWNNRVDIEFPFASFQLNYFPFCLNYYHYNHVTMLTDGGKKGEGWSLSKVRALALLLHQYTSHLTTRPKINVKLTCVLQ